MRLYGAVSICPTGISGGLRDRIARTALCATCSALLGDERAHDERFEMACAMPAVPSLPIAFWRSGRGTARRIVLSLCRVWDDLVKYSVEGSLLGWWGER